MSFCSASFSNLYFQVAIEFDPKGSNESSICEKFRELIQQFE